MLAFATHIITVEGNYHEICHRTHLAHAGTHIDYYNYYPEMCNKETVARGGIPVRGARGVWSSCPDVEAVKLLLFLLSSKACKSQLFLALLVLLHAANLVNWPGHPYLTPRCEQLGQVVHTASAIYMSL